MKKFLVILMVIAMASFLFVGCLGDGVTPPVDDEDGDDVTPPATVAPVITSIPDIVSGYVNAVRAADGIVVNGTAPTLSEVKVYINGICAGTGDVTATGFWTVDVANADLIKAGLKVEGAKTLHATATDIGLPESPSSNVFNFILDTITPFIASSSAKAGTALSYQFVETTDTSNLGPGIGTLFAPCSLFGDVNDAGKFTEVLAAGGGAAVPVGWVTGTNPQVGESLTAAPALNPLPSGTITWRIEVIRVTSTDSKTEVRVTNSAGKNEVYEYDTGITNSISWIEGLDVTAAQFSAATDIGAYVLITTTNTVASAGYVDVTFNEAVTGASIIAGTWTLYRATVLVLNTVSVRSATVARLTETTAGTLIAGVIYSVSVSGIIDLAGNTILATAPSSDGGVVIP